VLKVQEIRELIKLIDQSSLDELVYEEKECKIKLRKNRDRNQVVVTEPAVQSAPVPQPAPAPAAEQQQTAQKAEPVAAQQDEPSKAATQEENLHKIVSPMVGTFYSSPSPEEGAYVKQGDKVTANSVVCIVEAMKLFNEIEAEVEGEIVEVLVKNGQLVEYGQPLFLVKPE
jgi:acetyl-CoA carboxylase biotin carboxyl carrier protein